MDMTTNQKRAIRSPCFAPEETTAIRFGWRALDPTVTVRLTLNVGME